MKSKLRNIDFLLGEHEDIKRTYTVLMTERNEPVESPYLDEIIQEAFIQKGGSIKEDMLISKAEKKVADNWEQYWNENE
jgi:hypothetical protein